MQEIKRQIELGNVQLARINNENKPVRMEYEDLLATQKTRNNYARLVSKLKQLSAQQKYEWVNLKKLHASQLFKKKQWSEAMEIYLESMLGLNIQEKDQKKLKEINLDQKYPILLNLASCNYQLKNYKTGAQLCDKILQQKDGRDNLKAIYKKINCLIPMGQLNKAYQLTIHLKQLVKQGREADRRYNISMEDIANLLKEINSKKGKQKQVYQKMFTPKDEQQQPLEGRQEEELLVYNYGLAQKCKDWCRQLYHQLSSCLKPSKYSKES